MAVSASKVRDWRRTLEDVSRAVGDDEEYRDFADAISSAMKTLDDTADEHGQMRDERAPKLGSRVQRDSEPTDDRGSGTGRRPVPEQFRR